MFITAKNSKKRERMNKVFKLFGAGKSTDSKIYRREKAQQLHGNVIRYVTEMKNGNEDVVGKGGNISVRNGQLIVFSSSEIIMRAEVDELDMSDLMSGDGVIISGKNLEEDGKVRTLTVHYVYHRK